MLEDTITAIATTPGESAIGIIRISGGEAFSIADRIFSSPKGKRPGQTPSQRVLYGYIIEPSSGEKIDEVLLTVMRAPSTFTADDVVEINCHGGVIPLRAILELVIREGARLAEPGEFAKRAFLNGRIDLAQAESIIDIIRAKTGSGLNVALNQLQGSLSQKIRALRAGLLELLAYIEAGIDFPEHDIEELSLQEITHRTQGLLEEVAMLLEGAETGKIYREGLRTVIIGRPNVGKSSLLNALLRESRAIVTDVPGTTRDVIEEYLNIRGIPLKIIDTAGIRETEDVVEKIGVEKTRELFSGADLVLYMLDASCGVTPEDLQIMEKLRDKQSIIIFNKVDLAENQENSDLPSYLENLPFISMSVRKGFGLEELETKIVDLVQGGKALAKSSFLISNVRHKQTLDKAHRHIKEVLAAAELGMPTDFMAIDLKEAWEALGEITGDTVGEDIIDQIFSQFCLGK